MQTTTLVRASADIVRIVNLRPGDVYKRTDKASYSTETALRFGIVQDVLNNGDETALTALEFSPDYSGVGAPALKVWADGSDVALFAATPDELRAHFDDLLLRGAAAVQRAKDALDTAERQYAAAVAAIESTRSAPLTAPQVEVAALTAGEFPTRQ